MDDDMHTVNHGSRADLERGTPHGTSQQRGETKVHAVLMTSNIANGYPTFDWILQELRLAMSNPMERHTRKSREKLIIHLQKPLELIFNLWELILTLWELLGVYIQPPGLLP